MILNKIETHFRYRCEMCIDEWREKKCCDLHGIYGCHYGSRPVPTDEGTRILCYEHADEYRREQR